MCLKISLILDIIIFVLTEHMINTYNTDAPVAHRCWIRAWKITMIENACLTSIFLQNDIVFHNGEGFLIIF